MISMTSRLAGDGFQTSLDDLEQELGCGRRLPWPKTGPVDPSLGELVLHFLLQEARKASVRETFMLSSRQVYSCLPTLACL